jgi:competence protein ComEC
MNALPLLWLSVSFLFGLLASILFSLPGYLVYVLFAVGLFLVFLERRFGSRWVFFQNRKRISPIAWGVLVIAFSAGFLRYQTAQYSLTREQVGWYNNSGQVTLVGKVTAPSIQSDRVAQVRLQVQQLYLGGVQEITPISGMVLLWVPKNDEYRYGDLIQADGKLITPFEDAEFSYKDYLARQGIFSLMPYPRVILIRKGMGNPILTMIYSLREKAYQTFRQLFPMPEASVFAGILLGIQSDIPEFLYQAYQASGTSHVLVISGFNIAIIAALISRIFRRILPYGWDALASVVAIGVYTVLVGAQPPVVRAAIMGIIALPAYLLGRRLIGLNVLAFTAALMVFFSPSLILDVSFQLSFLATLGIMVFTDPLQVLFLRFMERFTHNDNENRWTNWVVEYLLVTLAAQFAVFPVILFHFNYLSIVSLPANLLILPVQPAVMVLGGIALVTGMLFLPAGQLIARLAWLPAFYSDQMAVWMGALPFAAMRTSPGWAWPAGIILIAALIPALHYQFTPRPKANRLRTSRTGQMSAH